MGSKFIKIEKKIQNNSCQYFLIKLATKVFRRVTRIMLLKFPPKLAENYFKVSLSFP